MMTYIWVSVGSGNGLLPWLGTHPLLEPMLTDHQWGAISQEILIHLVRNMDFEILEISTHLPGINELMALIAERYMAEISVAIYP